MSNGTDEIADIRKRLEETERVIGELRAGDLAIMKLMATESCEMYYNIASLFQKTEEIAKYTELWSRRLADTKRTIQDSETIEAIIGIGNKFAKDITDYVKEEKVDNADKAMEIAHSFILKDSPVALPLKVERQDDIWLVDIDAGTVGIKIVKVKVDAKTGNILGHEIIEKK